MDNNDLYAHLGSGFSDGSIPDADNLSQELNAMPAATPTADMGLEQASYDLHTQYDTPSIGIEQYRGSQETNTPYSYSPWGLSATTTLQIPAADRLEGSYSRGPPNYIMGDQSPLASTSSRDQSFLQPPSRSPESSSLPSPITIPGSWDNLSQPSYAASDVHSDNSGEPPMQPTLPRDHRRPREDHYPAYLTWSPQDPSNVTRTEIPILSDNTLSFTPQSSIGRLTSSNFPPEYAPPIATDQRMLAEGYAPSLGSFNPVRRNISFVDQTSNVVYDDGTHIDGHILQQGMSPSSSDIPEGPFTFIQGDAGGAANRLTIPSMNRSRSRSESAMAFPHPDSMMVRSASQNHQPHRRRRPSNQASNSGRRSGRDSHSTTEPHVAPLERGKRKGNLPQGVKADALERRKNKDTCITCKLSRVRCERSRGSGLCRGCEHPKRRTVIHAECTRADFKEFVQEGTTNYIAQYSMRHLRWNEFYQHRIDVPEELHIPHLLSEITSIADESDIVRVSEGPNVLYELNLSHVYSYLSNFRTRQRETYPFRNFIDKVLAKKDKWMACINRPDPTESLFKLLYVWDNNPGRRSFELVSSVNGTRQFLNPNDPEHHRIYDLITVILRILGRRLEITAYDELASNLASNLSGLEVMETLGLMLLSLRWRICWWELLRGGLHHAQRPREDLDKGIDRVSHLCRVLYMWFTFSFNKRMTSESLLLSSGTWSVYDDLPEGVYETFPTEESSQGYTSWMEEGKAKMIETGVYDRLKSMPLL